MKTTLDCFTAAKMPHTAFFYSLLKTRHIQEAGSSSIPSIMNRDCLIIKGFMLDKFGIHQNASDLNGKIAELGDFSAILYIGGYILSKEGSRIPITAAAWMESLAPEIQELPNSARVCLEELSKVFSEFMDESKLTLITSLDEDI